VKLVEDQGPTVPRACQGQSCSKTAVRPLSRQYDAERLGQSGIGKRLTAEQQCTRQLEQKNRQFKAGNDILKSYRFLLRPEETHRPDRQLKQKADTRAHVRRLLNVSRKICLYKVRRLLRANGSRSACKRKYVRTTDSKHDVPIAESVLKRRFGPQAVNTA
jgi:transposase-like protein